MKTANIIEIGDIEPFLTDDICQDLHDIDDTFDPTREVLLFHGTKKEYVTTIIEQGLRLDKAKPGMFGKGIYFCERSQKADQYSDDKRDRNSKGLIMLIARVALGNVNMFNTGITFDSCDSIICGIRNPKLKFREILIGDDKQCFVQYVVVYDRNGQQVRK